MFWIHMLLFKVCKHSVQTSNLYLICVVCDKSGAVTFPLYKFTGVQLGYLRFQPSGASVTVFWHLEQKASQSLTGIELNFVSWYDLSAQYIIHELQHHMRLKHHWENETLVCSHTENKWLISSVKPRTKVSFGVQTETRRTLKNAERQTITAGIEVGLF